MRGGSVPPSFSRSGSMAGSKDSSVPEDPVSKVSVWLSFVAASAYCLGCSGIACVYGRRFAAVTTNQWLIASVVGMILIFGPFELLRASEIRRKLIEACGRRKKVTFVGEQGNTSQTTLNRPGSSLLRTGSDSKEFSERRDRELQRISKQLDGKIEDAVSRAFEG